MLDEMRLEDYIGSFLYDINEVNRRDEIRLEKLNHLENKLIKK